MAQTMMMSQSLMGRPMLGKASAPRSLRAGSVIPRAANDKVFFPGVERPDYLAKADLAGDYGWDPLGLGADETALRWYRQSELQHARWAMLGVAGILGQEIINPGQWWYTAGIPSNLPTDKFYFGPNGINLGGILAWEFLLMHWVEVRRWQDYKKFGSVNQDPIFKGNSVPNPEMGYPGGIFDPFGFSKGNFKEAQTKEIKNGRLAMVAFAGFTLQAQATGKGPLANLSDHLSNPFGNNIAKNIGVCHIPTSVDVGGIQIPTACLWPGQHL
mmetsp:Transcript_7523/g.22237  ORF Transcript_7523/g.22237 Transcript_7523/m.22237 type:complete len:271 (-) Transcript_7523:223-1035(-)|eukprot:CAMPEP_0206137236 /NCGR_PEP_ID=MMETSP1473-20131121/2397_1 /ASSEMBLY_ACC=CAM_ASM_001109 /TAXON_ID=1461547 /ORGANISM="Stichococcus sp, Strain RCC1054" /LENGTH=270 /DNA_ID=CAMNT_0053530227 /DNA_START=70 /DNA_END=882 /DNA_ORIENTATION=+